MAESLSSSNFDTEMALVQSTVNRIVIALGNITIYNIEWIVLLNITTAWDTITYHIDVISPIFSK